jgi:hypothetical protein
LSFNVTQRKRNHLKEECDEDKENFNTQMPQQKRVKGREALSKTDPAFSRGTKAFQKNLQALEDAKTMQRKYFSSFCSDIFSGFSPEFQIENDSSSLVRSETDDDGGEGLKEEEETPLTTFADQTPDLVDGSPIDLTYGEGHIVSDQGFEGEKRNSNLSQKITEALAIQKSTFICF